MNTNSRDPIEQQLVDDAHRDVPDAGFTLRVMAALPAPTSTPILARWKLALVLGSTLAGGVLAMMLAPAGPALLEAIALFTTEGRLAPSAIAALVCAASLLVSAALLAAEN